MNEVDKAKRDMYKYAVFLLALAFIIFITEAFVEPFKNIEFILYLGYIAFFLFIANVEYILPNKSKYFKIGILTIFIYIILSLVLITRLPN